MMTVFTESEINALTGILEYNKVRFKRRRRYFSRDGTRYMKKPITPERYEEWLRFDADILANDNALGKLRDMTEFNDKELEFLTRMMRNSIDYSIDFLQKYSADGRRFNGKTSSQEQYKQWDQRKRGLPEKKARCEKLLTLSNDIPG